MGEWKEYVLEDVIDRFIDYRGKTPKKTESGVPLVTAKIVKGGSINEPTEFIANEDYKEWMTRGFPKVNDVVLTTEAPLGEVALLKDPTVALAQRIIILRGKANFVYNPFLKYYLQSPVGQYKLRIRASGSTVSGIKSSVLRKTVIDLPDVDKQRAIAEPLLMLDAKIDLLRQQNETLEALGAAVFREWFSRKEYDKEPISSVLKIVGGGTPSTKVEEYWNGSIFWTTPKDLSTNSGTYLRKTLRTISEEGLEKISSGLLHKGTLLMSSRAPVGYLAFAGIPLAINQGYIAIVEASYLPLNYVYYWLKANMSYIKQSSNGSVFQEISKTVFRSLDIEVPDEDALAAFDRFVSPILAKIEFNQAETEKLEETRDLLLPKLMSGQVKVRTDG